ncbi:sensor histidine kinase [Mangrovibacterium diazotrophicum]|uniref:histidine kinase n=1 Tax=Mangrovibacterium diazotrophicum TaxID=1261403 RepID=A0A419W9G2_9BACT|nr:PAS domain-containing sensor histidine kinase [Mangrovibacterium diazotrophicum]RKD92066.1 PAS domain S-box-containing protein [Mangrovibacterium diazotrophicum]
MKETGFNYEHFFEISPDLLCIAGFDGYFKKINSAVTKVLGYSFEELYARPINDFVHPEDQSLTDKVRSELHKARPLYNFENRYITKSGEIVWLAWTSLPVQGEKLVFAIAKNITHKKKLEQDRSELLTRLTHVNQDLKQLTYTTSHDLRSPVNNVLAVLDLLDISTIDDQDAVELINILKLSGECLKETLDNYIDTLNQKHETLANYEEVDLEECLQKVLRSISTLLETSKTELQVDFSEAPNIKFNNAYMESVFLNLLTNSIKYSRPGSNPVIQIRSQQDDRRIRLTFTDNGQGFDMPRVQDKVFGLQQKFNDSKDAKGIGLYLVHNHITTMGGEISLESELDQGAKFIMRFLKDV